MSVDKIKQEQVAAVANGLNRAIPGSSVLVFVEDTDYDGNYVVSCVEKPTDVNTVAMALRLAAYECLLLCEYDPVRALEIGVKGFALALKQLVEDKEAQSHE